MNNQVKIIYNPYQKTIRYRYRSAPNQAWGDLYRGSELFSELKYQQGSLQNYAGEIIDYILKDCCTDGRGVDLFFSGTDADWEDLKEIVRRMDVKQQICCCDGGGRMISSEAALEKIDEIFKGLAEDFADDPEIKADLDKYLDASRSGVVLVVAGAYSAGKSSFINALIGEELLPTASSPTTAKIFKVTSLPQGTWSDTVIRFQYGGQSVQIRFNQDGYYLEDSAFLPDLELKRRLDAALRDVRPSPAYVCRLISVLNEFNSQKNDSADHLISDWIEIDTPFVGSTLPLDRYQFTICDTPGPNAAKHIEHKEAMEKALEGQTNGLPLLLTEPDHMSSTIVEKLWEQLSGIKALDTSNIMLVVNKADLKGISTLVKNLNADKEFGEQKNVFFVSSVVGLGAKKPNMDQCIDEDASDTFDEKKPKFIRNEKARLFLADKLPEYRLQPICEAGEKANEGEDMQQRLLHNSGLWAVENEISRFAEKYAAYNKSQQAQTYLSSAIRTLKDRAERKNIEQKKLLAQIVAKMSEKEQELVSTLDRERERSLLEDQRAYQERIKQTADASSSMTSKHLKPMVSKQWKQVKKNDEEMQRWIIATIREQLNKDSHDMHCQSRYFWGECVKQFKDNCIHLVTESDALSDTAKEFLKGHILRFSQPEFDLTVSFNIEVQGKKKWRFLFWSGKEFDEKTCANNIERVWMDNIHNISIRYSKDVLQKMQKWYDSFIGDLEARIADFNPTLKELVRQQEVCSQEIQHLEDLNTHLTQSQAEIRHLFELDNEEV